VAAACLTAAAMTSCSDGTSAPPVATITISTDQPHVVAGGPLHLTYTFTLEPGARLDDDYLVFVQGLDDRGHRVWTDDHEPAVPTSLWQPGHEVQYTRTTFLPVVSYVGPLTIHTGLYRNGDRLPLAGPDGSDRGTSRAYRVGAVQVLPQSAGIFIEFGEGWHDREFAGHDPALTWRWTQGSARATIDNPRQPLELYLEYDVPARPFSGPQHVVVSVGGQVVATVEALSEAQSVHRIPVPAEHLGETERVELRLDVSPTFVPADLTTSTDTRELGVRVRHLHLQRRE
jgi:hypothetical protein